VGERLSVLLLSLLAAAHVFFFSAAFPFFSVVDEQVHFDLVVRYSQANIPRSLSPLCDESLPFIILYGTPEYLWPPATQPGGKIAPPPWKQSPDAIQKKWLSKGATYRETFKNHEAASPPLYYALAGAWWKLGKAIGMDGGPLLYWLRFLNVPLVFALTWIGWITARNLFPENSFIRITVPALIAFLPQATFYAINNDILTAVTFGIAFMLIAKFCMMESPSPAMAIITGLALAAAFLTKMSTLPLIAVAALVLLLKILVLARRRQLVGAVPLVLLIAAAVPMVAWMLWCKANFGDVTGSSLKIQFLGWTEKPIAEWLHHPLFTWDGLWYFLKHNLATFWQGEQLWQRQPLAIPGVDAAYVALTLGSLALVLVALLLRPPPFSTAQRPALWFAFGCVVASLAFYALLSVKYDFHDCFYPSQAKPFFVSGRLMLGMLVPFMILFAVGLDRLLKNFQAITKFSLLIGLLAFMLISEITINGPIFNNEYNWFHL